MATTPFLGDSYHANSTFYPPVGLTNIIQLVPGAAKKSDTVWGVVGYGLDLVADSIEVYVDNGDGNALPKPKFVSSHLLKIQAPQEILSKSKRVTILASIFLEPKILRAPNQPAPKGAPKVTHKPTVPKLSSAGATFKGENLKAIQRIEFEGTLLRHQAKSDKELIVFLTRAVTKESGPVTLLGFTGSTSFIPLELTVK